MGWLDNLAPAYLGGRRLALERDQSDQARLDAQQARRTEGDKWLADHPGMESIVTGDNDPITGEGGILTGFQKARGGYNPTDKKIINDRFPGVLTEQDKPAVPGSPPSMLDSLGNKVFVPQGSSGTISQILNRVDPSQSAPGVHSQAHLVANAPLASPAHRLDAQSMQNDVMASLRSPQPGEVAASEAATAFPVDDMASHEADTVRNQELIKKSAAEKAAATGKNIRAFQPGDAPLGPQQESGRQSAEATPPAASVPGTIKESPEPSPFVFKRLLEEATAPKTIVPSVDLRGMDPEMLGSMGYSTAAQNRIKGSPSAINVPVEVVKAQIQRGGAAPSSDAVEIGKKVRDGSLQISDGLALLNAKAQEQGLPGIRQADLTLFNDLAHEKGKDTRSQNAIGGANTRQANSFGQADKLKAVQYQDEVAKELAKPYQTMITQVQFMNNLEDLVNHRDTQGMTGAIKIMLGRAEGVPGSRLTGNVLDNSFNASYGAKLGQVLENISSHNGEMTPDNERAVRAAIKFYKTNALKSVNDSTKYQRARLEDNLKALDLDPAEAKRRANNIGSTILGIDQPSQDVPQGKSAPSTSVSHAPPYVPDNNGSSLDAKYQAAREKWKGNPSALRSLEKDYYNAKNEGR